MDNGRLGNGVIDVIGELYSGVMRPKLKQDDEESRKEEP